MTRAPCDIANIGLVGRRRRMTFGIVALAIGFVAAVALVYAGIARPWRLVLALPILAGVSGVLQAREHT